MRYAPKDLPLSAPQGFIVLEGVNGAGKTTLAERILALLTEYQRPYLFTREPGATPLGKELRRLLLESPHLKLSPNAELLLFGADRAEHVTKVLRPALAEKRLVVSDRYYYSTVAFQGYGRRLDHGLVQQINNIATGALEPDFVILLDIDAKLGLERSRKRQRVTGEKVEDSFELETLAFHERIREGFLALADSLPTPFLVLDAEKSPEQLFAVARDALDRWVTACGAKSAHT